MTKPRARAPIGLKLFKTPASAEATLLKVQFQAAVAAAGVKLGGKVAKMKVREVESGFA